MKETLNKIKKEEKTTKNSRFFPIFGGVGIIPFLLKHWQAIAIVVLISSIIIYHQYRTYTISSLQSKLELCTKGKEELAQLLQKQNNRIEELVKKGRMEAAKFEELKTKIESSKLSLDSRINIILSEPKPQTCENAIKYLIDAKKELAWPE